MTDTEAVQSPFVGVPTLIYSYIGESDLGRVPDSAARQLAGGGFGQMQCLAALAGDVADAAGQAKRARLALAIDGCKNDCARNSLKDAGVANIRHICVVDLDDEKGPGYSTPVRVNLVVQKAAERLKRTA